MFPWTFPQKPYIHLQREVSVFNHSLVTAHSIRLHPGLAETITGVMVLLVTSAVISISVPGCCDYSCWQLDTDRATQCCQPLQLELSLLSAGRGHLAHPVQHCAEIPALRASCRQCKYITDEPLHRMMALQRWDAGAKQKVLLRASARGPRLVQVSVYAVASCCVDKLKCWRDFFIPYTLVWHSSHAGYLRKVTGSRHSTGT